MNHAIESGVAGEASFESLLHNTIYLLFQCIHQGDGRSRRGVVFRCVFLKFNEVEIVTTSLRLRGSLQGCFGNSEDGQSGRQGECLLHTGKHHIYTELVHLNGNC